MFLNFTFVCQKISACLRLNRPRLAIVYCYTKLESAHHLGFGMLSLHDNISLQTDYFVVRHLQLINYHSFSHIQKRMVRDFPHQISAFFKDTSLLFQIYFILHLNINKERSTIILDDKKGGPKRFNSVQNSSCLKQNKKWK